MKKFTIRFVLVLSIVIAGSLLLNLVIYPPINLTPWSRGSELLHQKRAELLQQPGKFNTLLIGSSRVYRQINPFLLDSITGPVRNIKSYNLGVNWLFAPESFYVLDQLTGADKLKFKCVVVELSKIRSIDYANLHTARTKYWYTFSNYTFAVRAVMGSTFSFPEKVATSLAHTISYFDQLINLGYLTEAAEFYFGTSDTSVSNSATGDNGFKPFNEFTNNTAEENVTGRHLKFLDDTTAVTKRSMISARQFAKFEEHPELLNNYNYFYAEALNNMIYEAEQKGIYLVFLMSPRIDHNQYNELIPLFNQINENHRIEISDARKYPELYRAAYSFDDTHLNREGADLYTTILATKLNAMLNKVKSTSHL